MDPSLIAQGGIAEALATPQVAPQEERVSPQDVGPIDAQAPVSIAPSTGSRNEEPNDEELVKIYLDGEAAVRGEHSDPENAISLFIFTFGEQAFMDLQAKVENTIGESEKVDGGLTRGPGAGGNEGLTSGSGDGLSDSIPAIIDGEKETSLSSGEFVVAADVVGHLGNGDTNAGAQKLMDMMAEMRMKRTGNPNSPPRVA